LHARNVHVSVASGEGQRSMTLATVTVMEEVLASWLTLTLLHDDVEEEE
jgi:hypothetical protein